MDKSWALQYVDPVFSGSQKTLLDASHYKLINISIIGQISFDIVSMDK